MGGPPDWLRKQEQEIQKIQQAEQAELDEEYFQQVEDLKEQDDDE